MNQTEKNSIYSQRCTNRAWIELNMENLKKNIHSIQKLLPPGCEIMAVLKDNAYGHGDTAIAAACSAFGIRSFAAATLSEGIRLRESGVTGETVSYTHLDVYKRQAKHSGNTHGCAYGATKAGLSSFTASLFEEVRKYGVRVAAIHPDMTRTGLYRNADFCCAEDEECALSPKTVARAVETALFADSGCVITDITLQPQKRKILRKAKEK